MSHDAEPWASWLGFGNVASRAPRRGDALLRARKAGLAWGLAAIALVGFDVLTGIFPIGPLGALVMTLLAVPLGGLPGYFVERLAYRAASSQRSRILATLGVSLVVFFYLSVGINVVATLLGHTTVANMFRQVAVCVVATGPVCLGSWIYLRATCAPRRQQHFFALVLLVIGILPAVAERIISIEEYRVVHTVLRWGALAGVGSALFVALPEDLNVPRPFTYCLPPALLAGFILFPFARSEFAPGMQARPFGRLVLESLRTLVDFDRDGYAQWLGYGDCAPFDANVNPGRPEIPGNGVDDNCRLGDAAPAAIASQVRPPIAPRAEQPSIVLITSDALRSDHLSAYGYPRPTTPNLDRFAQSAALFTSAFTPGTRTGATLPAMNYGVWPERLAWTPLFETTRLNLVAPADLKPHEFVRRAIGFALEQSRPSLPQLLKERGFVTALVADDGTSPFLDRRPGFLSDYDHYWQMTPEKGRPYGDEATSAKAREVLRSIASGPFFLWVHFFGTHTPTTRSPGVPEFGYDQVGGYDHEICAWDAALGKLLADVDELAKTREIATIVTSDHGEVFTPIGRAHGVSAEEANFHVPLIVRAPGMPTGKNEAFVSSLDIAPMLLNLTGGAEGLDLDGRDLRELAATPELTRDRILFSGASAFNKRMEPELYLDIAIGSGRKVVYDRLRNQVDVRRLGDFSDAVVPADATSERLLKALFAHIERTPGMYLKTDR